jgi:hypothetical protein
LPPGQVAEVVVDRRHLGMLVVQADGHGDVELVLALGVEKMLRQLRAIATTPTL